MKNKKTKTIVESGILLAIALVLSFFQPLSLPYGGGITFASMLPLVIIAYRHGIRWGVLSSGIYSVLQLLTGFRTVSAMFLPGEGHEIWWRAILICFIDYIIAYTLIGFSGIFRKNQNPSAALCLGSIFGVGLRYIAHIVSGAIFFGTYSEWFFTDVMGGEFGNSVLTNYSGAGLAIFYSSIYNGLYMIPELIITAVLAYILGYVPIIAKKEIA